MKRFLSVVLSFIILLLSFSSGLDLIAFASTLSGACGDNVTWLLDTETGELVISGTGDMTDYSNYSDIPWSDYETYISTITIEYGVTSIGDDVFNGCSNLTSIVIPNSVTSIGEMAFSMCKSLTSVIIPESVTSIGESAFYDCESLTSMTIPESITSIGEAAFYYCLNLTSIDVDNDNAYFISSDGVLFNKDKTELIQYPIGNERTFYEIPDSVLNIEDLAFRDCTTLTSIEISGSVTSIGSNVFAGCTSLESVTIQDGVTSIGIYAFDGCTSLANITIPESVTSIGEGAFNDCSSLTSVTVLNKNCIIEPDKTTVSDTAVIYGYSNSTAEDYAEIYNREFVKMNSFDKTMLIIVIIAIALCLVLVGVVIARKLLRIVLR